MILKNAAERVPADCRSESIGLVKRCRHPQRSASVLALPYGRASVDRGEPKIFRSIPIRLHLVTVFHETQPLGCCFGVPSSGAPQE